MGPRQNCHAAAADAGVITVLLLCIFSACAQGHIVTTLAGSGSNTSVDGTGTGASFWDPVYLAVDASGNVIVSNDNFIRKVSPGGVVSTLAGSGLYAFTDGTGAGASFRAPNGVAFDASGNVIVADTSNHRIRKVTPGGVVSTFAGSGSGAFADGPGTSASFSGPYGIAIDAGGSLFVSDNANHRIRFVTPGGMVSTLAGSGVGTFADGTGTNAAFRNPRGVAIDPDGNLIVADTLNNRIRKVTVGGLVSTLAGPATFTYPSGVS